MRCFSAGSKLMIIPGLAALLILLPSCRRAPEEPTELGAGHETQETMIELTALDLPQENPTLGITLNDAPRGLVATYNGEYWIGLTDQSRPTLTYTLVSSPEYAPGIGVLSVTDFEAGILAYENGEFGGSGEAETALGFAKWANGSYSEDGEILEQLYLTAPHPSGGGELIVTSICPRGVATIEERLAVIQELLKNIS